MQKYTLDEIQLKVRKDHSKQEIIELFKELDFKLAENNDLNLKFYPVKKTKKFDFIFLMFLAYVAIVPSALKCFSEFDFLPLKVLFFIWAIAIAISAPMLLPLTLRGNFDGYVVNLKTYQVDKIKPWHKKLIYKIPLEVFIFSPVFIKLAVFGF